MNLINCLKIKNTLELSRHNDFIEQVLRFIPGCSGSYVGDCVGFFKDVKETFFGPRYIVECSSDTNF